MAWEYASIQRGKTEISLHDYDGGATVQASGFDTAVRALGMRDWELVSVDRGVLFFRRTVRTGRPINDVAEALEGYEQAKLGPTPEQIAAEEEFERKRTNQRLAKEKQRAQREDYLGAESHIQLLGTLSDQGWHPAPPNETATLSPAKMDKGARQLLKEATEE
jgi:hypothetical protein